MFLAACLSQTCSTQQMYQVLYRSQQLILRWSSEVQPSSGVADVKQDVEGLGTGGTGGAGRRKFLVKVGRD